MKWSFFLYVEFSNFERTSKQNNKMDFWTHDILSIWREAILNYPQNMLFFTIDSFLSDIMWKTKQTSCLKWRNLLYCCYRLSFWIRETRLEFKTKFKNRKVFVETFGFKKKTNQTLHSDKKTEEMSISGCTIKIKWNVSNMDNF